LTGTVIPLELAFEHRNYFASIGLYLALFAFLLPLASAKFPVLRNGLCVVLIVFFAAVTWIRALNWGNPLLFALNEAQVNPHSPRATYDLANIYMVLCQEPGNSQLIPVAFEALQHAADMPGANMLPEQGLLLLSAYLHRDPSEDTWAHMQYKLATQPLSDAVVDALYKLASCAWTGRCAFPANEMINTFHAALQHQPPNTRVLSIFASYAFNVLHDSAMALDLARDAVKAQPGDLQMRYNLLQLLAASGQRDAAETFYAQTLRELPQAANNKALRAALDTPAASRSSPQPTP
jgi:tetratricopeptide (TPR) repeat protein